jgi:hypothetical protein
MGWATCWAILSKTHLASLPVPSKFASAQVMYEGCLSIRASGQTEPKQLQISSGVDDLTIFGNIFSAKIGDLPNLTITFF